MALQPHVNHYRLRQVAQANEKACSVCYRPTSSVLMSKDSKDWFYVCAAHLQPGFATPVVDEAAEKEKLKQAEIARTKAEYEARQKARQERKAAGDKEKSKQDGHGTDKDNDKKSGGWFDMFRGASEPAGKADYSAANDKALPAATSATSPAGSTKEWVLHRTVYNHRCELKLKAAQEKARAEQWSKMQFPSAPGAPIRKHAPP